MAPSTPNPDPAIAHHYRHGSLLDAVFAALRAANVDPEAVTPDQLSQVDEFHTGGRAATVELADQMAVAPGASLLDVGSGIGGPSRYFASRFDCFVTGIDLSPEYCDAAAELSRRTGLSGRTQYHQSSAASLPFDDASFDGAYMLHVGMNLPSKAEAFREVARVLKPGSVFGIFDMMREAEGDLTFPVPWASAAEISFVETPDAYAGWLRAAGFTIKKQRGRRDFALAFFRKMQQSIEALVDSGGPAPPGLPILMGVTAPVKVANLRGMIERGLLAPVEIISRKM